MAFATFCTGKCRVVWLRIESMVTRSRLSSFGVVLLEGAQDHRVASPARQQIVDLVPQCVVAAHAAAGLEVKTVVARGQLRSTPLSRRARQRAPAAATWLLLCFKFEVPWFEVSQGPDAVRKTIGDPVELLGENGQPVPGKIRAAVEAARETLGIKPDKALAGDFGRGAGRHGVMVARCQADGPDMCNRVRGHTVDTIWP